ncbi:MAG: hypothetical protein A3208_04620 [Candidatus Methanoprimaticola hominis]|nr:MAG: hypothetical protein A3208_04620 [Methanomassiliicoccales archaeon Mx-06]
MMEDEHTEFKREYTPKMFKNVVAFLNTEGGSIYVGIDDSGDVVGVSDPDSQANSIVSGIADNIRPDSMMFVRLSNVSMDGHPVIRVDIAEGCEKPYYWKEKGLKEGGVFIRRGPASIPASDPLIVRMINESRNTPYEDLPSLKQNLTFDYAAKVFRDRGLELGETQMRSLGMMDGEMYTNLALILSDQCPQGIKMAVFDDEYKSGFLDREEATGSLFRQFDIAYDFVQKHNNKRSVIEGKVRRDIRDYPEAAVREVIVNALVHRDYAISGSILISMFGDGMTVSSIGGMVRGLDIEDLMMGVSSRRNEKLASVMYRLGYMESYGTGIPRIMGLYRDSVQMPRIETSTSVFKITLPKISTDVLSADAAKVVSRYSSGDVFTRADLEEEFSFTRSHSYEVVRELLTKGAADQIGTGRGTSYRLR